MKKNLASGCGGRAGCLFMALAFIIALISVSTMTIHFSKDNLYKEFLNKMGFENKAQFEEFSNAINAEFDETLILNNLPIESDKTSIREKIQNNIVLKSGDNVFLQNSYLNIGKMQNQGDVLLNNDFSVNDKELAIASDLLLNSVYFYEYPEELNNENFVQDVVIKQINYQYVDDSNAKLNYFIHVNTKEVRAQFEKYGNFIPEKLLFNLGVDLKLGEQKILSSNGNLKINNCDEAVKEQFVHILGVIFNKTNQEVINFFSDAVIDSLNEVFTKLDCKIVLKSDIITITKKI